MYPPSKDTREVRDSILFDGVEVRRGARLQRVIVDEGVKIPPGMIIEYDRAEDAERLPISPHGIVVGSDS